MTAVALTTRIDRRAPLAPNGGRAGAVATGELPPGRAFRLSRHVDARQLGADRGRRVQPSRCRTAAARCRMRRSNAETWRDGVPADVELQAGDLIRDRGPPSPPVNAVRNSSRRSASRDN